MKKFILALMLSVAAVAAFAEPSFQQVQGLIEQRQFSSAAAGLEEIIRNHPQSAKAFYAMAQAQAGLGDLPKAKRALDKARGLDPELKFASQANVASLEQAITPQVKKVERVEESSHWGALFVALLLLGGGVIGYILWTSRRKASELPGGVASGVSAAPVNNDFMPTATTPRASSYPPYAPPVRHYTPPYTPTPSYQAPQQPTVVNNHYGSNGGGSGDMLTGVLVGSMLSGDHHSHDRIVEREVIREVPARDSSWDTPVPYVAPVRDSSWDTPAEPERSSSWDDEPAKKSDSSWSSGDSGSSSSDWSSSSDSSSSSSDSSWDN